MATRVPSASSGDPRMLRSGSKKAAKLKGEEAPASQQSAPSLPLREDLRQTPQMDSVPPDPQQEGLLLLSPPVGTPSLPSV